MLLMLVQTDSLRTTDDWIAAFTSAGRAEGLLLELSDMVLCYYWKPEDVLKKETCRLPEVVVRSIQRICGCARCDGCACIALQQENPLFSALAASVNQVKIRILKLQLDMFN
jgi:hypothetical protein